MAKRILPLYFARRYIESLNLTPKVKEYTLKILDLAEEGEEKIQVLRILEELFPLSTRQSANTQLKRLLDQINQAADKQGLNFKVCITPSKKAGAAKRWVWFEGETPPPGPAYTSELKGVPENQLITNQKGLLLNEPPTVVLLTVNKAETQAVLKFFSSDPRKVTLVTKRGRPYNILDSIGPLRIVHTTCEQGRSPAQEATKEAILAWQPVAVIGVGIAFGLQKEKQKLGDVLVSKTIQDYEPSKFDFDGTVIYRGAKPPAFPKLFDAVAHLDKTLGQDPSWPRVHFGNILSGDKLVNHHRVRNQLLQIDPEAIGAEMEGAGISSAAHRHNVPWIIIKGISDWGDGTKAHQSKQQLAAENAALVTKKLLEFLSQDPDFTKPSGMKLAPELEPPGPQEMQLIDLQELKDSCLLKLKAHEISFRKRLDSIEPVGPRVEVLSYLLNWVKDPEAPLPFRPPWGIRHGKDHHQPTPSEDPR